MCGRIVEKQTLFSLSGLLFTRLFLICVDGAEDSMSASLEMGERV